MTKTLKTVFIAGLLGLSIIAPAIADDGQLVSTLLGAGLGGWAGSYIGHGNGRIAATGAGVLLGGAIGNELGRPSETTYPSSYPSYSTAAPVYYYSPYQPNYVAPPDLPPQPATYIDGGSGNYCRQYSQTIRIGGRVQESYGTACLQPDGSWHIVQ